MTSSDIRRKFIDFFKQKGHVEVPSDLLMPGNDPTVLFTGAGMNQFKEQFMGKNITYSRAASCQKCLRTGDLDNVGKTPRHHTFFEMLGNFSFGDYFKKEAIQWAWEFLTVVLGISSEKLFVSVYRDDVEAYSIWKDQVGIDPKKIEKLGEHDNFWPADAPLKGPNGPCGPCSEIFYDRGVSTGCGSENCGVSCDCGRFVEVWNLVFTQFERMPDGKLEALPARNIDTGMGLERITAVVCGADNNFETDLFLPLISKIEKMTKKKDLTALRVIADHVRAVVFAINDGVAPSNEKRGYVVRKLIRRAWLKGRYNEEPFIFELVPLVIAMFHDTYPEMEENMGHIAAIVEGEERRFIETLRQAEPVLEDMISSRNGTITGEDVFKLVDTYGMPLEVISDICESRGALAMMDGFHKFMEKRKEQSRKGSAISCEFIFKPDIFKDAPRPEFSDELPLNAIIAFMVKNGNVTNVLKQGDCGEIQLSPSSGMFYAEAGGQVGDRGFITRSGSEMVILNTLLSDGRKIHQVTVESGVFSLGDTVKIDLDMETKRKVKSNHTATHLLQSALRAVLGTHVKQAGSFVDQRKLRFDFTYLKKLSSKEVSTVETIVNEWIEEGIDVCIEEKEIARAKEEGALSFFGEKYADVVRVVKVGKRSMEFCGGTHVSNTSDIRLFKIVSESSVASGIRRIEAVTGDEAEEWLREKVKDLLSSLEGKRADIPCEEPYDGVISEARDISEGRKDVSAEVLKRFEDVILPALMALKDKVERERKKAEKTRDSDVFSDIKMSMDDAVNSPIMAGAVKLISMILPLADMSLLRKAASYVSKASPDSAVFLGGGSGEKAYIVCLLPESLVNKGLSAKDIISDAACEIGGSGGRTVLPRREDGFPTGLKRP